LKRAFDLTVAGTALVFLAPLFAAIAIAIKLESSGPVFFKQPRVGWRGRRFQMLKFRSMDADAELRKDDLLPLNEAGEGLFKLANDPRVTRVGVLLRRLSLDELPQLINVLKGDMSLVGPRPLVPEDDRCIEGFDRRRLAVPPGMTGIWQVLGSSRVPMREMVKLDYLYAANWSLWTDVKLLIRTVPLVYRSHNR
jgi:lipopolysaccharide/colanic/teichoic acid biosynthesis glycosyltransferase